MIDGLRVLVTAGANGIGLATARAFAAEGAKVHVCDVDEAALAALAESDPAITRSICDVSDRKAVARLFDEALSALGGGLDCLVNNAGIAGPTGRVDEIAPEDWDSCLAIDLTGQFNCTRLAVAHLKQSGNASIVNLSSLAGKHGFPLRSPYGAAKWGVIGLTKTLAIELGQWGIRANAIAPGAVEGDRIVRVFQGRAQISGKSLTEVKDDAMAEQSIKAMIDPKDIAQLAVFLASPAAKSISGQVIPIDNDRQRA